MSLRLLTLDATGTIFRFCRSPIEEYVSVAANYGFKLDPNRVQKQVQAPVTIPVIYNLQLLLRHVEVHNVAMNFKLTMKKMEAENPHFGAKSQMDSMKWWITVAQETLKGSQDDIPDANAFMPIAFHLYKFYSTSAAYEVYPDFVDFARKLRSERPNVRTAVISNFDKRISNILMQLGVMPFIDNVIYSEAALCSKPNRQIFEKAIENLKPEIVEPHQVLHVGDDLTKDYKGPKLIGWNALLLNRSNLTFEDVPPNHVCKNFIDVEEIIRKSFTQ